MRLFIPEDLAAGDTRSVHFLSFPEVKEEYFDAEIERKVQRMQAVIDLGRNVRERNNISLKVRASSSPLFLRDVDNISIGPSEGVVGVPYRSRISG